MVIIDLSSPDAMEEGRKHLNLSPAHILYTKYTDIYAHIVHLSKLKC
jgi:hypothetical protein